ncbi:neutral cholesterol ester hydrolase 1-like [Parambassis ranga]|uniref:Neutral cholesterol ester hydrolase 1 n=1 Tax=Parambassis ranga TaxID=210632 RepID=A0A6P7H943_9TELE|nr:neutral cholesterol ester hydrolase 1-like [Parambassis ranga]
MKFRGPPARGSPVVDGSLMAIFHQWLGYDHYIITLRRYTEGPESDTGVFAGVKVSDVMFAGIPVRVYEPPAGGLRRGLMYYHGGGFALCSGKKGSYDATNRMLSEELDTVVVSVESCLKSLQYEPLGPQCVCVSPEILAKYAVDPERVAVSGDSAGGNLAAAVAQEISTDDSMSVKFSVQALIYPALQGLDINTPSYIENQYAPSLNPSIMVQFWLQYLNADLSLEPQLLVNNHSALRHSPLTPELRSRVDWTTLLPEKYKKNHKPLIVENGSPEILKEVPGLLDVRAAPLLASPEVLAKLPRTYIITCEHDVLRDDGLMYARRLQDAGVMVTNDHYEDGFHGCFSLVMWPVDFDVGKRMLRGYISWLQKNL